MTVTTRTMNVPAARVWNVLADGWLYPVWVVGATRMREVESSWPAQGAQLHHSFGVWPAIISDSTEVLDSEPPRSLRLRARGWPIGEAEVLITLTPTGDDTMVTIQEDVVSGPGLLTPRAVRGPLINVRNVETLRRLAYIAENHD
jgi:uncharacterized protein YndB with AHSA1/START domain